MNKCTGPLKVYVRIQNPSLWMLQSVEEMVEAFRLSTLSVRSCNFEPTDYRGYCVSPSPI